MCPACVTWVEAPDDQETVAAAAADAADPAGEASKSELNGWARGLLFAIRSLTDAAVAVPVTGAWIWFWHLGLERGWWEGGE